MRKVNVNQDVYFTNYNGEAVLLDISNDVFYALDDVGTQIWMTINKEQNYNRILVNIAETYDTEVNQIEQTITEFLLELEEKGLITIAC